MADVRLLVVASGTTEDVTLLAQSIGWSGRNGSSSRELSAVLTDDGTNGQKRVDIDVERGDQAVLMWKDPKTGVGTELFRGLIMRATRSSGRTLEMVARDLGIYLANNKDTFVYANPVTATDVFMDVCGRFGIPTGNVASTGHQITDFSKPKTTGWDAICEALTQTYEATGARYFPIAREGKMHLVERRANFLQYLIECRRNVSEYTQTASIEKVRTRIKAYDKEDNVVAEAADTALEARIGVFQDIETADDEMSQGEVQAKVDASLREVNKPERSLEVRCSGIADVITGTGVYVRLNELGLEASYYVESDDHSFDGATHEMTLSLSLAEFGGASAGDDQDGGGESAPQASGDFKVGDIVNFAGGPSARGSDGSHRSNRRTGGPVKITSVAKGASHPYHVVGGAYDSGVGGTSNVYGWVEAALLSR